MKTVLELKKFLSDLTTYNYSMLNATL